MSRLDAIRDGATRTGDLRSGCHDLSRLHEDWLEPQLRRNLDGHTADEIVAASGQHETRLATTLRDLAYGARAPTPSQFGKACERLEAVVKRPPKGQR